MDYLWVLVLLILGVCMVCYPKILWKIENLFTVKNGEPTELYLVLMRIGGVFFYYLFSWYDYISNYKMKHPYSS